MFTALYPSFVLVRHDLLSPEHNQRLAEIAGEGEVVPRPHA